MTKYTKEQLEAKTRPELRRILYSLEPSMGTWVFGLTVEVLVEEILQRQAKSTVHGKEG